MKRILICFLAIGALLMFAASAEIMKCDDDIIAFFQTQSEAEFSMTTTSDMYERLTKNDWSVMERLELLGGIAAAKINGKLQKYGVFEFSETERIEAPYEIANDDEAFNKAVEKFASASITDFSVVCMGDLYTYSCNDDDHLAQLIKLSKIDTYRSVMMDNGAGIVCRFMDVSYTDAPKLLCYTGDDILTVMKGMSAAGISEFVLIIDNTLFTVVSENDFKYLYKIEREAGIIDRELLYSDAGDVLFYQNVRSVSGCNELGTIKDLREYVEACAWKGDSSIIAICSDELYQKIDSDCTEDPELPLLWGVIQNSGIYRATTLLNDARKMITINILEYYPGFNIARAFISGDSSSLSEHEKETMDVCESLAAMCKTDNDLDSYINIHDAVCVRVSYDSASTENEKDTAIGALLNHRADCDGYADAFFAIASIAGLPVRYQCGATGAVTDDSGHMWNLISIDGSWRAVDTTWDDEGTDPVYLWFNIGKDRLSVRHRWNPETTVEIEEVTDFNGRPAPEYFIESEQGLCTVLESIRNSGYRKFALFFSPECDGLQESVLPMMRELGFDGVISFYWDKTMRCYTVEIDDR